MFRTLDQVDLLDQLFFYEFVGNLKRMRKRLYHLDRKKDSSVSEKGTLVNGVWDKSLREDGEFKVKDLSRTVDAKFLHTVSGARETRWNKLVPKRVNMFVLRALKGILPVRDVLERRGIDLDSVLCPSCNIRVETCAYCLTTCDLAMSFWDKIFNWWNVGDVNVFSINEFFSSNGSVNVPTSLARVWKAVIWSTGYFIWKERNVPEFCIFKWSWDTVRVQVHFVREFRLLGHLQLSAKVLNKECKWQPRIVKEMDMCFCQVVMTKGFWLHGS
ncbi:RNA-directed DNA polymerase, eukaryota, reverse transcriptase zinc-binding domain protein [Tanacetum coccineum]